MKRRTTWLGVFLVMSLAIGAMAVPLQADQRSITAITAGDGLSLVGHWGGSTYSVAADGSYVYIGQGPRLVIVDVSSPAAPALVGPETSAGIKLEPAAVGWISWL